MDLSKRTNTPKGKPNTAMLIWIIVAGLAIILGGLLISTLTPYVLPRQGSAEAVQVDDLFRFMLAIGGMIFLLVQGVLLYSAVRFRAKPDDLSDGPPIHGNTTLELVWTIIPSIVVLVLAIYSYQVWVNTRAILPNEQAIDVVGQRFAWSFNYTATTEDLPAGVTLASLDEVVQADFADGGNVSFTSNQLHTWVNQPVRVSLTTPDVNHAFWIPDMRIKQDLLAGRVTDIRFTPIEVGVYRIVCAELCGSGHGDMAGTIGNDGTLLGAWVIVHPDEETYLREFYYPELNRVIFPPEDPVELGRQLISAQACNSCHTLPDLGWQGIVGPDLSGISTRIQRLAASGNPTLEDYLHQSIREPGAYLAPGYNNLMPAFTEGQISEDQLNAIIAYLMTQ